MQVTFSQTERNFYFNNFHNNPLGVDEHLWQKLLYRHLCELVVEGDFLKPHAASIYKTIESGITYESKNKGKQMANVHGPAVVLAFHTDESTSAFKLAFLEGDRYLLEDQVR